MDKFRFLIIIFLFVSCQHDSNRKEFTNESSDLEFIPPPAPPAKGVSDMNIKIQYDIRDSNIINTTNDKRIDVLFNGVENFLGGIKNYKASFNTECLMCEPIQEYNGGLLFARRLMIKTNMVKYYKTDIKVDSMRKIRMEWNDGETQINKFRFSNGFGTIKYLQPSCNDANFYKVTLEYNNGKIVVNNLLNAEFFEFDIDKNGRSEQYLIGTRNCSQELVILRITNNDIIKGCP